jgi:hypothetical protein
VKAICQPPWKAEQEGEDRPGNSIPAFSMFVAANFYAGRYERAMEALDKLQRLKPVTPEDFIFKGHAQSFEEPSRGLSNLDEAVRRRKSGFAYLMRAQVLVHVAWEVNYACVARFLGDNRQGDAFCREIRSTLRPTSRP